MSILAPGTPVPEFTLEREDGSDFTREDLLGHTTVLVFYPFAFSPTCTDASWSQKAFKEKLGVSIEQLSDFEPKGEAARAFGAYFEPGGMTNRALVIVGPDGVVRWSHLADSPGDLPGVGLIFDGLAASAVS